MPTTHSSFEDVHPSPEHCDRGKEKNISNICDFEMLQTGRSTPAISCTDPRRPPASASTRSPRSGLGEKERPLGHCFP